MPWNGSGVITLLYDWTADRDAGDPDNIISADKFDDMFDDFKTMLENCQTRDGQNGMAADLDMNSNQINELGDPVVLTDAANASSVAENTLQYGGTTGGTANAQTVTNAMIGTVGTGTRLLCLAGATNTGATTLNVNAAGAVAVVQRDGTSALTGGEIVSGDFFEVAYDGTSFVLLHASSYVDDIIKYAQDISGNILTGGTSTVYTASSNQGITAYEDGFMLGVRFNVTCGASPTINVDSVGAKALQSVSGTAILADQLLAGSVHHIVYDSGADAFIVMGFQSTLGSGTRMIFNQTSAPTGWTKDVAAGVNNNALRITTGTVSSGGTTGFSTVFASRTLVEANLPSHTHTFSATTNTTGAHTHTYDRGSSTNNHTFGGNSNINTLSSSSTGSAGNHSHTVSGTTDGTGSGTGIDFDVLYQDVIIASKD